MVDVGGDADEIAGDAHAKESEIVALAQGEIDDMGADTLLRVKELFFGRDPNRG